MKEKTTYGLTPEELARLLAIGLKRSDTRGSLRARQTPAEVLQGMLSRELSLDPAKPDSLPAVLKRPCDEVLPTRGETMMDSLTHAETDLTVIRTLKDYAKKLAGRRGPEAKQAAATVIYYAAIASALVFHGNKITQHSCEKLQQAYGELEQKQWVPSELKDLFKKAKAVCRQRKGKKS